MAVNQQEGARVVLCEMCPEEERKPARKTCMKCEISMCVQHLQAHLTTPVLLQTHPLTEPMDLGGGSKCPQHGKLLEYYCLDDLTCVCVSCAIEDQHRLHNMKTFPTAHKELAEMLEAHEQALMVKSDDENTSLEKWEVTEREKLRSHSRCLIESINHLQDIVLTGVQTSVAARMAAIKTSKSSIQASKKETDTFRFLQMYSQVKQHVEEAKAVDFRKGLEPGSKRDKLVGELMQKGEEMLVQADQLWYSLLSVVDPENHQIYNSDSEMIFVPQIMAGSMSLSEDKRTLFYHKWLGECSATLQLLNEQPAASIQSWLVKLSSGFVWTIGICDRQSLNRLTNGYGYYLCCKDNQATLHTANNAGETILINDVDAVDAVTEGPLTMEVCWNVTANSLAFFSRPGEKRRREIVTIEMGSNKLDLVPFIQVGQKYDQTNNGSVKIKLCVCDSHRNMRNSLSGRSSCTCGAIFNSSVIVCELQ